MHKPPKYQEELLNINAPKYIQPRSQGKYILRDYQLRAVVTAVDHLRGYGHPFIIQAATGAGKSLIIAEICHQIDEPILILQPSKEILEQNYAKLVSYDPLIDAGIYSASVGRREIRKFTFATIGSIRKIPEQFMHFKYVLIDECHGVNPKKQDAMLTSFLKTIGCKNVCGLTATPYRIDQKWTRLPWGDLESTASLKMINRISRTPFFKKIAYKIETQELIDKGYLVPIKYFYEKADWSQLVINSTGADFKDDENLEKFARSRVNRIAAAIEYSHQNNQRTLVFCQSIAQAETVKELVLEKMGISTEIVTGSTAMKDRERRIADFKDGKFKHLINVGVFTTGFDAPVLDCIVMARPTMSLALWYQIVGRGVRIDPENPTKILQVYDLVGVTERLGRVETIHVKTEHNGYRDEVWSEVGRMDDVELYSFIVPKKVENE